MKRKNIKAKTSTLFKEYETFCHTEGQKSCGKTEFYNKLEAVGITYRKSDGFHKYIIDYSFLQKIADKFKWIHETDVYKVEKNLDDHTEDNIDDENILVIHNPKYEKILKNMKSIFPNLKL